MKKAFVIVLCSALCLSMAACSSQSESEDTTQAVKTTAPTTAVTTTTEPAVSTTAVPSENIQKGEELKTAVLGALGNENGAEITGDLKYGSFTYKFNREPETVYGEERSEELEEKAKENAQRLVDEISTFYTDDIVFNREYAAPIGNGDNGIDSVQYQFFYLNSQNQQLKIYADSDGTVSYAECGFTW